MANFRGCPNIEMIWHGNAADPELLYKDHLFNYWEIEDTLWEMCKEELEKENVSDEEFNKYCRLNAEILLDSIMDSFNEEDKEIEEDEVECGWCHDKLPESNCRYEKDLGYLCSQCAAALKSRGETLEFIEPTAEAEVEDSKESIKDIEDSAEYAFEVLEDGSKVIAIGSFHHTRMYTHELIEFRWKGGIGHGDERWMNRPWHSFTFAKALEEAMIDAHVKPEFAKECIENSDSLSGAIKYFAEHYKEAELEDKKVKDVKYKLEEDDKIVTKEVDDEKVLEVIFEDMVDYPEAYFGARRILENPILLNLGLKVKDVPTFEKFKKEVLKVIPKEKLLKEFAQEGKIVDDILFDLEVGRYENN